MNWLTRVSGLWRVARRRAASEQDYLAFQAYQARWLIDYLAEHDVALSGRRLLDLGSGVGGYSLEFARAGARVITVDLMQPLRAEAQDLSVKQVRGDALRVPLKTASCDIVFCASLIEHVRYPEQLLAEIERVLKPGGQAYVSFPPYYSPPGGHEFAPFHYLGERMALKLVPRRRVVADWVKSMYAANDDAASFGELYAGWGLYRMTIGKMRRLIAASDLRCEDMSTRYLPISAIRWPLLNEVLTWHAQFLLRKPTNP